MICPTCRREVPPDSAFCDECGARLELSCPDCGETNRPTAKFCRKCGRTLGEPIESRERDSTGVATPSPGAPASRAYQASSAAIITRFEGHIAQYLGDGLLGYLKRTYDPTNLFHLNQNIRPEP